MTCALWLVVLLAARVASAAWLPAIGPGPLRFASPPVPAPPVAHPPPPAATAALDPVSKPPALDPAAGTASPSAEPAVVTQVTSPSTAVDSAGPGLGLGDLFLGPLLPSDADLTAPQESLFLLLRQSRLFLPPEAGLGPPVSFTPPVNTSPPGRSTFLTP